MSMDLSKWRIETVPKDQAWFWTEKWQAEEREVDEEIRTGQISDPQNLEDFIHDLEELQTFHWRP